MFTSLVVQYNLYKGGNRLWYSWTSQHCWWRTIRNFWGSGLRLQHTGLKNQPHTGKLQHRMKNWPRQNWRITDQQIATATFAKPTMWVPLARWWNCPSCGWSRLLRPSLASSFSPGIGRVQDYCDGYVPGIPNIERIKRCRDRSWLFRARASTSNDNFNFFKNASKDSRQL